MASQKKFKNISSLVRLLTVLALFSGVAIISLGAFGIHSIYSRHVINMAEKEAVLISRLLANQQHDLFFSKNPEEKALRIDPSQIERIDKRLREFLHPFDIVKIKIFDLDTRILYSTDNAIIDETVHGNERLQKALSGQVDSHLEQKERLRDLQNETEIDVDVVETYSPLLHDGEVVGVFELYRNVSQFRKDIRDGTLKSLLLLSSILVIVYLITFSIARIAMRQVSAAEESLRNQAMTDALTGVYNRGELMNRATEEVSRVVRHGPDGGNGELSLVMLDIDHFKQVNDEHGHLVGDAVLRQLAGRIKEGLRLYDILGRYGGEEFLLLLPNADLDCALIVAERIRRQIAQHPFTYNGHQFNVTISLGLSSLAQSPNKSLTEAVDLADQALFQAKESGRNRVVIYQTNS